jgi:P27 family predicted phage terminase small subunit
MGRRGPAPLTTPMLKLRGSPRASMNRDEPAPRPGRPRCPRWLDKEAKRAWRELVPELEFMGVLARIDRYALTRYCQLWARWVKAEQFIQKYGETYPLKDENGKVKCFMPWPQAAVIATLSQQMMRLEQEFGLTPSARTRLRVAHTNGTKARRGNVMLQQAAMHVGARQSEGVTHPNATPQRPVMSIHEFMKGGGPQPPTR